MARNPDRNVKIGEEAIEVYAPPAGRTERPTAAPPAAGEGLTAPRTPLRHLQGHEPLVRALDAPTRLGSWA